MKDTGNFFALEGVDGSGKTTLASQLMGFHVKCKEPTDSPFGRKIREMGYTDFKDKNEELGLFLADRKYHQRKIVRYTEGGANILVDRYILSTFAYQSTFDFDFLYEKNKEFKIPDITIFIDVDPNILRWRLIERGSHDFDKPLDELVALRKRYFEAMEYLRSRGWNFEVVDGEKPIEQVLQEVQSLVSKKLLILSEL